LREEIFMLRIQGSPRAVCDGIPRRTVLEAAGAGLLGLSLPRTLAAAPLASAAAPRAKSVIFVFLFGGPSQLETFDCKPDAPEKIRGPFKPIACRTPGLQISEHLPGLAQVSDRFCVVRTMSHPYNDHSGAAHYLQTGKIWHVPIGGGFDSTPKDWPSMGSVVEYHAQRRPGGLDAPLPAYVVLPNRLGRIEQQGQYRRPGQYGGWLGRRYDPLSTTVDRKNEQDNPYWRECSDQELAFLPEGLSDAAITLDLARERSRHGMLAQFDRGRAELESRGADFDLFRRRAVALATSPATRKALNVRLEPPHLRDRYGRHLLGQSLLLARRLVEAGVQFVTVHYEACDGYSWDSHLNSDDVKKHLLPTFDQALSSLLVDLEARGLLDETLVVALGEMGRTPQPTGNWGRGHWSTLFPAVLAGAGVRGGSTYGTSDKNAAYALDTPVTPEDLAATIYHALGIDPATRLIDPQGRPVSLVEDGEPVRELFG
jgi:hypothetical protein